MNMRDRAVSSIGFRPPSNAVHNNPMASSGTARTLRRDYSEDVDLIHTKLIATLATPRDSLYEADASAASLTMYGPHADAIQFMLSHSYLLDLAPTLMERYDVNGLVHLINTNRAGVGGVHAS